MEFPDTTLNSALTNHLSHRLIHFLGVPDLEEEKRNRSKQSDNLPRQLAGSLKTLIHDEYKNATFRVHSAYDTPLLLDFDPDRYVPMAAVQSSLELSNDFVSILVSAAGHGLENMMHAVNGTGSRYCCIDKIKNRPKMHRSVHLAYQRVCYWQSLVDTTTQRVNVNRTWAKIHNSWINRHLTIILISGEWIILPHDALLMIKDIVWGVFLLKLYANIDRSRSYISDNIEFFHSWGKRALSTYGDQAYNLIKMVEPIATAGLIRLSETLLDADSQLSSMVAKYNDKEREISSEMNCDKGGSGSPTMADQLRSFVTQIKEPNQLSELFSLAKMMGHPYVDPVAGSEALKKLARTESKATFTGVKAVEWSFCHMFTKGFIDKRKKWPPLVFNLPIGKKSRLKDLCEQQHMPLPLGLSIYDPSDWDFVTFLPVDEFDYGTDILSLMTDKSLSYKRSEVDVSWSGRLPYTPDAPTSSNRVLEQLLRHDLDMVAVCQAFATRAIPWDWRIVVIQPKEREAKTPVARNFAIMTIEPRSFFCLTEMNLAEKIFPFIPEQTMTMQAHEKEEVFLEVTQSRQNCCVLSITLDLSKWCSHFRRQNVSMIADRLNQLLGVERLYGAVHDFFEMCLIILRHPSFTPQQDVKGKKGDLTEEPGIYKDAETGLEGICQKLWTLITLCMLHWALWRFGLSYKITCQGDNLVVYITVYKTQEEGADSFTGRVRSLNQRVLKAISESASMIGHDVNPDECFSSTSFTTYGKDMWLRGVKLETLSKVVSRMFPKTSTDVPSTDSIIANIAATGTSLVERSNDSLTVFFFTKFVESLVIRREMIRSMVHQSRIKELPEVQLFKNNDLGAMTLCCLIPSNLGGLPVSSLAEYMYRGHSDPLSSSVGSLNFLSSITIVSKFLAGLEDNRIVGLADNNTFGSTKYYESRARLIRDPYSIPIKMERGAVQSTSDHIKESLRTATKNRNLKAIVEISTDAQQEMRLISGLLTTTPLNPKLVYEIHKSSVFGLGNAIARRFTDTRTVRRMAKNSDVDLISAHVENDFNHFRSILRFLGSIYLMRFEPRKLHPYELLVNCRQRWGLGILEGVTNYHPLVAGKLIRLPPSNTPSVTQLVLDEANPLLMAVSLENSAMQCVNRGRQNPYLGNMTSEKSVSKWTKPIDSSPPLRDALRLIQLAKLCTDEGSLFRELIVGLAIDRTNLPINVLMEVAREQIGGTSSHRVNISESLRGSSSACLPNWSTNFNVSSNLSRQMGSVDYPVSYSEYYLSLLVLSSWIFSGSSVQAPFGLVHLIDLGVLEPIQDSIIDLPRRIDLIRPKVSKTNYYLYATTMTLSARSRVGKAMPTDCLQKTESDHLHAIQTIFLSALTGTYQLVRKGGYIRSKISHRRLIDLPEASLITLSEYVESASVCIGMFAARLFVMKINRSTPVEMTLTDVFLRQSFLLAPLIFATVAMSSENDDDQLRLTSGSGISERNIIHLACVITSHAISIYRERPTPPPVYEQTKGSMSTSISTRIYYMLAKMASEDQGSVKSCKFLCRLVNTVLNRVNEEARVSGLCHIISSINWMGSIKMDEKSSELRVRSVRSRVSQLYSGRLVEVYNLPRRSKRSCMLTDSKLVLSDSSNPMTDDLLIESWSIRPFPGKSDANLRWSPISSHLSDEDIIYIVGIGSGGILRCIPNPCQVYGLDLPKSLAPLGQSFVNYESSFHHPHYSTRPISWMRDLSKLSVDDMVELLGDIKQSKANVVLIDVDGVRPSSRVAMRNEISVSLGVDCWVKVHAKPMEIIEIERSVDALRSDNDDWWIPAISVGTEIIYGKGCRELGVFKAIGSVLEINKRILPSVKSRPKWDELMEFVSVFNGNLADMGDLHSFIFDDKARLRRGEGSWRAFDVYGMAVESPGRCLSLISRRIVRLVLYIVPWYL